MLSSLNDLKLKIYFRFKYRKQFSLLKEVIRLGEKIFTNEKVIWEEGNYFSKIIIVFSAMAFTRIKAVKILCKNGFAKDAIPLLRIMFEDLVNFKYIFSNKNKIQDYIDFDDYLRIKLGNILLENITINDEKKEEIRQRNAQLKIRWDSVKHKFSYTNSEGRSKIHNSWSCKPIEQMCLDLGDTENYQYLYQYFSNFIHPSTIIADSYILGLNKNKNTVVVEWGASEQFIDESLSTITALFLDIMKIVNDEYKMGYEEEIKNIYPKPENKKVKL